MDVFLADVPANKVFVLANYRSTFTNVFAIRNNAQGRRLMRDWIAVISSGYIQCHGYDQAGLSLLVLQRLSGDVNFTTYAPLNYTCFHSHNGSTVRDPVILGC